MGSSVHHKFSLCLKKKIGENGNFMINLMRLQPFWGYTMAMNGINIIKYGVKIIGNILFNQPILNLGRVVPVLDNKLSIFVKILVIRG